jgi:FkbM family methyltransferase
MPDKKLLMYSQDFEDFILFCALEGIENGFYVDVGANSPWHFSVTKLFYDRGWSGINIEPLEGEFLELCRYRPRDINLNIGAGDHEGEMEFIIAGFATTCDAETKTALLPTANCQLPTANCQLPTANCQLPKETIPIKRLSSVLQENLKDKNQAIHFCKIDVEGYEKSVLEGMDFDQFRPWVMVMEAMLPGTDIPCFYKWEYLLLNNHYEFVYSHGINRYYLDSRCALHDTIRDNFKNLNTRIRALEFDLYNVDKVTSLKGLINIDINDLQYKLFKYYLYFFLSKICPIDSFRQKMSKYKKRINSLY